MLCSCQVLFSPYYWLFQVNTQVSIVLCSKYDQYENISLRKGKCVQHQGSNPYRRLDPVLQRFLNYNAVLNRCPLLFIVFNRFFADSDREEIARRDQFPAELPRNRRRQPQSQRIHRDRPLPQ